MINIFQTQIDEIRSVLEDARQMDAENQRSNPEPGPVFMRAVSAEQVPPAPQDDDLFIFAAATRFILTSDQSTQGDRLYRRAMSLRATVDHIPGAADADALSAAERRAQADMRTKNLDPFDRAHVLKYIRARFEQ